MFQTTNQPLFTIHSNHYFHHISASTKKPDQDALIRNMRKPSPHKDKAKKTHKTQNKKNSSWVCLKVGNFRFRKVHHYVPY